MAAAVATRASDAEAGRLSDYIECGTVRAGLLLVHAALPTGAFGKQGGIATMHGSAPSLSAAATHTMWTKSVLHARTPTAVMEALLALEDSVDPGWYLGGSAPAFRVLPGRASALRLATWGAVGLRLAMLDATLQYDRVRLSNGSGGGSAPAAAPELRQYIGPVDATDRLDRIRRAATRANHRGGATRGRSSFSKSKSGGGGRGKR